MKQTAVEFLELSLLGIISFDSEELRAKYRNAITKAKEIENQEKLECFIEGYKKRAEASNFIFDNASRMYATALFNETFNK